MKNNQVPFWSMKTKKGVEKAMSINDILDLMNTLKLEVGNGKDVMPNEYMKMWDGLRMVLNKINGSK